MKTGPSVSDVVPFKEFNVKEMLEECVKMGFMSDFHGFMKDIETYQAANGGPENEELTVLVVSDPEEKYGDNFYICLTMETKDKEFNTAQAAKEAAEAEAARIQAEAEAKAAADYARLNAVFEDSPVITKAYKSATEEATLHDITRAAAGGERPLLLMGVVRPRSSFGAWMPGFGSRDSDNDQKSTDFRAIRNPDFDLRVRVRDAGLQPPNLGATAVHATATQTPRYRSVNKSAQYDGFDADQPKADPGQAARQAVLAAHSAALEAGGGVGGAGLGLMGEEAELPEAAAAKAAAAAEGQMAVFLIKARALMEEALQQNETVDIYKDAFDGVGGEDSAVGQKGDNDLKELRTFNDIRYSKNMSLTAIDWHPEKRGLLAVAPARNLSFEERTSGAARPFTSYILLWDFADLIHPQVKLESPQEVRCFKFNRCPGQHNLVAAGCFNGQVLLFDGDAAMAKLSKRANASASSKGAAARRKEAEAQHAASAAAAGGGGGAGSGGGKGAAARAAVAAAVAIGPDEGEAPGVEPVTPKFVSSIDAGHKRMVADLAWLPAAAHVDARGRVLSTEHTTAQGGKSFQFMSTSGDGTCLIWDTRFAAIAAGELPHILKVRGANDKKRSANDEPPPWAPLHKMSLVKPNSGGDVAPCKLVLLGLGGSSSSGRGTRGSVGGTDEGAPTPAAAEAENGDDEGGKRELRLTHFMVATEEGQIGLADWQPPGKDDGKAKKKANDDEDGGNGGGAEAPEYVQWATQDHSRPCVALQPSPFFPSLLLSVGDWQFTLWSLPAAGSNGCSQPLFSSPTAGTYLTCGCWSPSRAGVLYIGRQDGCVDIWDLADSSHKPAATVTVSSTRVTSMEFCVFKPSSSDHDAGGGGGSGENGDLAKVAGGGSGKNSGGAGGGLDGSGGKSDPELMACGDVGGNLHVFEMPRNLWKPALNEHQLMGAFIAREEKRVSYVKVAKSLPPLPADPEPEEEEEPKSPGAGGDDEDGRPRETPEERAARAAEDEYQWLEAQVIEELGLDQKDLPEHWRKAKAEIERLKALAAEGDQEGQ